jgi:hypothetical protein
MLELAISKSPPGLTGPQRRGLDWQPYGAAAAIMLIGVGFSLTGLISAYGPNVLCVTRVVNCVGKLDEPVHHSNQ